MENAILTRKMTVDIPRAGEEELPFVYIIGCNVGFSWLARIFTMAVMLSNWLLIVLLVYITVVVYAAGEWTRYFCGQFVWRFTPLILSDR